MICVGARFDDRITGNLKYFSPNSKKIHIDIDPSSINKNVKVDLSLIGDCRSTLNAILKELNDRKVSVNKYNLSKWWQKIDKWKSKKSLSFKKSLNSIKPQHALKELNDQYQQLVNE